VSNLLIIIFNNISFIRLELCSAVHKARLNKPRSTTIVKRNSSILGSLKLLVVLITHNFESGLFFIQNMMNINFSYHEFLHSIDSYSTDYAVEKSVYHLIFLCSIPIQASDV
jgi:hypothetical protein